MYSGKSLTVILAALAFTLPFSIPIAAKPGLCCFDPAQDAERSPAAQRGGERDSHFTVLDFLGLEDTEPVEAFYDGGLGGDGSGPGPDFGITFSSNGLALISQEAGGGGNFANNPAGDTILFFLEDTETVMNVPDGFEDGFSFFYSAANESGFVRVYDEVGGQGNLLAEIDLPVTPSTEDTPYTFDNWTDIGVSFDGVARSVDFGGTADQIGFDNVTLGSEQAGGSEPSDPDPARDPALPVPVGGGLWILLLVLTIVLATPIVLRK